MKEIYSWNVSIRKMKNLLQEIEEEGTFVNSYYEAMYYPDNKTI